MSLTIVFLVEDLVVVFGVVVAAEHPRLEVRLGVGEEGGGVACSELTTTISDIYNSTRDTNAGRRTFGPASQADIRATFPDEISRLALWNGLVALDV